MTGGPRQGKWDAINRAKARRAPGSMNSTEKAWAAMLDSKLLHGEILWWEFEPIKLRVGPKRSWYSPDFAVVHADYTISMDEVKGGGGWDFDSESRAKFMAAVDEYPMFRFRKVQRKRKKDGGGWDVQEHEPRRPFPLVERPGEQEALR